MNSILKQGMKTQTAVLGVFFLPLPQLTLVIVFIFLFVLMVSACIKFTKGPVSTAALQQQLHGLRAKFATGKVINPQTERKAMEILQNRIKTSSSPVLISSNPDLKHLFYGNCKAIQEVLRQPGLQNRIAWIQLNALMVDFDDLFFKGKMVTD